MPPFIYVISLVLLLVVIRVHSSYYVYTYNNDGDDDENCCLVRLGENFCLAKPLTRSLVQVNKACQRLGANEKKKDYLNQIVRRLNVESSHQIGEKILLQLKNPLEKSLLNNDLLCLSTTDNNIDLEKCSIQLPVKKQSENETIDDDDDLGQVKVTEPVQIRQGHGLSVRQTYELNITDFQATTRQQRECWAMYRKYTKDILSHPTKSKKSCISLQNEQKKCVEELFYRKTAADETKSVPIGSKLYCENNREQNQLVGYHRRSEICFLTHYQIYLEHRFTDFLSLSDKNKNIDVLEFISNNTKLTNEFQADCNDKHTLDEIKKAAAEEEEQTKATIADEDLSTQD